MFHVIHTNFLRASYVGLNEYLHGYFKEYVSSVITYMLLISLFTRINIPTFLKEG